MPLRSNEATTPSAAAGVTTAIIPTPRFQVPSALTSVLPAMSLSTRNTAGGDQLPRPDRCPLCRFPSDDVVPPEPSIAALVTAAGALTLLLASRRRYARLTRPARIATAAAAITLTLAGFLAFVLVMS